MIRIIRASSLLAISAIVLAGLPAAAQQKLDLKSKEDTKIICDLFLQQMQKGDVKKSFNLLKPYITVPEKEFMDVIDETSQQRDILVKKFGKSLSFELVQEQSVKESLVKYTYIEKCKIHVIRWTFIFYKPEDKWILNSFYWDDKILDLFR